MTYMRIVLQRGRPAVEHSRAPRRRRLSHSHSSNRTITFHTSHTNPRGSVYRIDRRVPPNSPPTRCEVRFRRLFKTCRVKRNNSSSSRSPKIENLPNLSNLPSSSQIYHIYEISKSSIISHSFHQNIQTFNSPPVPMLLSIINFRRLNADRSSKYPKVPSKTQNK